MNFTHRLPFLLTAVSFTVMICPAPAHPGHEDDASSPTPLLTAATSEASVKNEITITTEGDFRLIKSNGWPDHAPGTFPRRGNPNRLSAQSYSFKIPLHPKAAESPQRRGGWWWGVALNGVPFEPGTAETWNNDPQSGWRYEAATGFLNLGLDEHNAHVQPNGSYHYHALPTGLVEKLGGDGKAMRHLGWAADGYPIYSSWAPTDPQDLKSPLREMKSSYRLKSGARPAQENGPGGNYDGRFTQDFEFAPGHGDLDECNGRTGVTPEFPDGTYYYCLSRDFPFVPRMWHGTPDPSFSKGDRPPGGPGGRTRPTPQGGAPRGILEGGPEGPPPPLMEALDLDKDGVLSTEEIGKAMESLKTLDKNGDGKLTPEEYRPAFPPGPPPTPNAPPGKD